MFRKRNLNTSANLIGGILLGVTGYLAMEVHRMNAFELGKTLPFWLSFVGAGCFAYFGWTSLGHNPGFGEMRSLAAGLRAMILSLMASCIVFGLIFIGKQLMEGFYLNPFTTLFDWFRVSFEYFLDTFTLPVWSILLLGSLIAGRLTGLANFRWR
jgi:hypothetical protein